MKITVVIPNWNGRRFLKDCLSFLKIQSFRDFEIIVVDNGSTDGSVEFIKKTYPRIKIIRFNRNYGFAKAVNQGIKASASRFVVLLNNDTRADANYLKFLVEALEKRKEACGAAPRVLNFSMPDIIDSAGDSINTAGQAFHRGYGERADEWDKEEEIFLVTAGASIYRREVFNKVGLFDEDFFAYGEDVDWCLRAQLLGCKFWYEPRAIVSHHHKATAERIPKKVEYLQFRNMTLTIIKNFPLGIFFKRWRFITIPLVHLNTILYMTMKGLGKEAILADLWILKHIIKIAKTRVSILSKRKASIDYLDKWMEPKKLRFWELLR